MVGKRVVQPMAPAPSIGPSLQSVRKAQRLTLEQLAALSGVSRSMLSQVERGEANPTFAVLWSLTQALGVDLTELIEGGPTLTEADTVEITTVAHTPVITSADGSCQLKILSPPRLAGTTEWYAVEIAPGGRLESAPHAKGAFEHFTAWTDGIEVTSGGSTRRLAAGETARYRADVRHAIANHSNDKAMGMLVLLW